MTGTQNSTSFLKIKCEASKKTHTEFQNLMCFSKPGGPRNRCNKLARSSLKHTCTISETIFGIMIAGTYHTFCSDKNFHGHRFCFPHYKYVRSLLTLKHIKWQISHIETASGYWNWTNLQIPQSSQWNCPFSVCKSYMKKLTLNKSEKH